MSTILIVEDTADLARILQRELEGAGYTVSLAADGAAALERLADLSPDLIVLDWMLPGIDGLEVLRRLRQTSATPVLMLTAKGDPIDRVVGLESGADDYLVKPFNLMELVARIRALLRRSEQIRRVLENDRAGGSQPVRWRSVCLDPDCFQASLDGAPLELTHIEFELLLLLLRHPGRTFNRNYLLDTIWDQPYIEGDRSVDNAILRLRKKLGPLGEAIETVRGVGYRLQPEGPPR